MDLKHPAVFILGAGATRGGLARQPIPPPVDADFFEIAGEIKGHGTQKLARTVLNDVWKLYGRVNGVGLESYFRDIETRARIYKFTSTANKPKDWQKRQDNLEELIRRVIIHTTCDASSGHFKPRSSKSHKIILSTLERDDTVITFNYDLLIEESFEGAELWSPVTGYAQAVHGITNEWCSKWLSTRGGARKSKSKVDLLKLHGSINWTLYNNSQIKLKDRPFVVRTRKGKIVFEDVSILPPGWNKRVDKNPYNALWNYARLDIEHCDSLVVIGYSLPDTDMLANALFTEIVRLRASRKHYIKQLHLIDPSDKVKKRFIELFIPALNEKSKILRYDGIDEFSKECAL